MLRPLRERGVGYLVTTTPELNGRSFGTNVMEGVLVAVIGKRPEEITPQEYEEAIDAIGFKTKAPGPDPEGSIKIWEGDETWKGLPLSSIH